MAMIFAQHSDEPPSNNLSWKSQNPLPDKIRDIMHSAHKMGSRILGCIIVAEGTNESLVASVDSDSNNRQNPNE